MQEFNEVKSMVMDAWVEVHMDAVAHGDGESEAFVGSLVDQISGYADMSAEDADTLGIEISDADIAAWQTFINQCAKEYLIRWQIATCWPDADILTADDVVGLMGDADDTDDGISALIDDYMDR